MGPGRPGGGRHGRLLRLLLGHRRHHTRQEDDGPEADPAGHTEHPPTDRTRPGPSPARRDHGGEHPPRRSHRGVPAPGPARAPRYDRGLDRRGGTLMRDSFLRSITFGFAFPLSLGVASAATITVTNTNDSGGGSLR